MLRRSNLPPFANHRGCGCGPR